MTTQLTSAPVQLAAGTTQIYQAPALLSSVVHGLVFSNVGTTDSTVTLLYTPAGGTPVIIGTVSIALNVVSPTGSTAYRDAVYTWPKPINMSPGDILSAYVANVSQKVTVLYSVFVQAATIITSAFNGRGVWNSLSNYNANDIVSISTNYSLSDVNYTTTNSYLALSNTGSNTNQNPTTETSFWMLLASSTAVAALNIATGDGITSIPNITPTNPTGSIAVDNTVARLGSINTSGSVPVLTGVQTLSNKTMALMSLAGGGDVNGGPESGINSSLPAVGTENPGYLTWPGASNQNLNNPTYDRYVLPKLQSGNNSTPAGNTTSGHNPYSAVPATNWWLISDVLVARNSIDTLTNKTFSGTTYFTNVGGTALSVTGNIMQYGGYTISSGSFTQSGGAVSMTGPSFNYAGTGPVAFNGTSFVYGYSANPVTSGPINYYGSSFNITTPTASFSISGGVIGIAGTNVNVSGIATVNDLVVQGYNETVYTNTVPGSTINITLTSSTRQTITLNGGSGTQNYVVLPSVLTSAGKSFLLNVNMGGSGQALPIVWEYTNSSGGTSLVRFPNQTNTCQVSAPGEMDMYSFNCDGVSWFGIQVGVNF